jgi:hypothetical protein
VYDLLEDNIRAELTAFSGIHELGLSAPQVEQLARAVATNVLYAFSVDWTPSWLGPGQVHGWEQSGKWFARCTICLVDSPASESREAAVGWVTTHAASHQG